MNKRLDRQRINWNGIIRWQNSRKSAVGEKRCGRKVKVRVEQDAELIGGIRVVVGDEVLDTSVKARLQQMKTALTA